MNRNGWSVALAFVVVLSVAAFAAPAGVLAQDDAANMHQFGWRVGGFVDEDGDGFNDLAPDFDGDGIPNCLDPDHSAADSTGTGQHMFKHGQNLGEENAHGANAAQTGVLNELANKWQYMWKHMFGEGEPGLAASWGPGDGTGYAGDGPGDGTGYGPGGSLDGPIGVQRTGGTSADDVSN